MVLAFALVAIDASVAAATDATSRASRAASQGEFDPTHVDFDGINRRLARPPKLHRSEL